MKPLYRTTSWLATATSLLLIGGCASPVVSTPAPLQAADGAHWYKLATEDLAKGLRIDPTVRVDLEGQLPQP
jgi:hypothetical protein